MQVFSTPEEAIAAADALRSATPASAEPALPVSRKIDVPGIQEHSVMGMFQAAITEYLLGMAHDHGPDIRQWPEMKSYFASEGPACPEPSVKDAVAEQARATYQTKLRANHVRRMREAKDKGLAGVDPVGMKRWRYNINRKGVRKYTYGFTTPEEAFAARQLVVDMLDRT